MTDNLIGLIFGISFILAGIIFLSFTLMNIYFNEKTINWKSLKGKILVSSLTEKTVNHSVDLDMYGNSTQTTYKNNIKFEYKIDNYTYVSEKIYYQEFNNWFASNKFKKELAEKYTKDKNVTIYLNPKETNKAFLIKKTPITPILFYSILCLMAGFYFILS